MVCPGQYRRDAGLSFDHPGGCSEHTGADARCGSGSADNGDAGLPFDHPSGWHTGADARYRSGRAHNGDAGGPFEHPGGCSGHTGADARYRSGDAYNGNIGSRCTRLFSQSNQHHSRDRHNANGRPGCVYRNARRQQPTNHTHCQFGFRRL